MQLRHIGDGSRHGDPHRSAAGLRVHADLGLVDGFVDPRLGAAVGGGAALVVTATVQVAQMIVADSVLSYLGVGISPPTPTWGRMLFDGQDDYASAPWLFAVPGTAIVLAVWGFNMLGEGLRDALDPRRS